MERGIKFLQVPQIQNLSDRMSPKAVAHPDPGPSLASCLFDKRIPHSIKSIPCFFHARHPVGGGGDPKRQAWNSKENLVNFIYLFCVFSFSLYFATTGHVSRFEVLEPPRAGPWMDAQMPQLPVPRTNTLAYASAYMILNSGFLNLCMTDIWGLIILCCEGLSYAL